MCKKTIVAFLGVIIVAPFLYLKIPAYLLKSVGINQETHSYSMRVVNEYFEPLDRTFRKRGPSFLALFFLLEQKAAKGQKEFLIVETGSLRVEPINMPEDGASTVLFDNFLRSYKGELHTVDLDPKCKDIIEKHCSYSTIVHTGDSVEFLENFKRAEYIDILYLDSYDLNWDNPEPSAEHHLKEIKAVFHKLKPGAIIIVDDNFEHNGKLIGKGYLVEKFLKEKGIPLIYDGYQKVFQIVPQPEDLEKIDQILHLVSSRTMKFFFKIKKYVNKICALV